DLLIADEPTTALDVTIQAQILSLLNDLVEERNMGLMLISHDLAVVSAITDRILVMYAGRIVADTPKAEILQPSHPYTSWLIASVPSLEGSVDVRLTSIPGNPPSPNDIPEGCAFHPRCSLSRRRATCREQRPLLTESNGGDHRAACHFSGELRA